MAKKTSKQLLLAASIILSVQTSIGDKEFEKLIEENHGLVDPEIGKRKKDDKVLPVEPLEIDYETLKEMTIAETLTRFNTLLSELEVIRDANEDRHRPDNDALCSVGLEILRRYRNSFGV